MPETQRMNPVGALFSRVWRLYKERFVVLIKIVAMPTLFLALGGIAITASQNSAFPLFLTLLGVLFGITGYVLIALAVLAIIITLEHKTDFSESYRQSTKFFWPSIWVAILVGFATLGGFVMLIVPGVILTVALTLTRFTLVLENRRGLDALTQSRAYVRGYWWAVLGRSLLLGLCFGAIMLVVNLAITLPAVALFGKLAVAIVYALSLLILMPLSLAYLYEVYKNLTALKPEVHAHRAPGGKKFLAASAIVGAVAPIVFIVGFIILLAKFSTHLNEYPGVGAGAVTGMHCGGFIQNAPTCPSGYHCQLNLRLPDTGGVCVED